MRAQNGPGSPQSRNCVVDKLPNLRRTIVCSMAKECSRCGTVAYDDALECDTCGRKFFGDVSREKWLVLVVVAALAMATTMYLMR